MDMKQALLKAADLTAQIQALERKLLEDSGALPEISSWLKVSCCNDVLTLLSDSEGSKDFTDEQRGMVSGLVDAKASILAHAQDFDKALPPLIEFLQKQWVDDDEGSFSVHLTMGFVTEDLFLTTAKTGVQ